MTGEQDTCEVCRFYQSRDKEAGACRRHPPRYPALWPIVNKGDWCGEWISAEFSTDLDAYMTTTLDTIGTEKETQ